MASSARDTGGAVKILIAGSLGGMLEAELTARSDLHVFDPHASGHAGSEEPDAVLYVAAQPQLLEGDIAALRTWTQAPIVVAIDAPTDALLAAALRLDVADVLALPQSADSLAFTMRKAAITATSLRSTSGLLITVFSPKGGSGKTVLSTNLAVAAAAAGRRTLLLDLDLQFGDAALMLGIAPRTTLRELAADSGELDADKLAGYVTEHESGLDVLAAPPRPEDADAIHDHTLRRLLEVAKETYDVVIVDSSPHFETGVLTALETTDTLLLVSVPEATALKNLRIGLRTLSQLSLDLDDVRLVLNRDGLPQGLSAREVEHVLERPLDFVLPNDSLVSGAVNRGVPAVIVDKDSAFTKAVTGMVATLLDLPAPSEDATESSRAKAFSSGVARLRPARVFAGRGAR